MILISLIAGAATLYTVMYYIVKDTQRQKRILESIDTKLLEKHE